MGGVDHPDRGPFIPEETDAVIVQEHLPLLVSVQLRYDIIVISE